MEKERLTVIWAISTFDRRTKRLPVEIVHYRLDWIRLTEEERNHVVSIMQRDESEPMPKGKSDVVITIRHAVPARDHRAMLKYRKHFFPYTAEDMKAMLKPKPGVMTALEPVYISDYFEDETGKEITRQEIHSSVAGREVLICGEVDSVLRLGLVAPTNTQNWTVATANTIYQFFSVTNAIARSNWLRHDLSITSRKESEKPHGIEEATVPIGEITDAVMPLFLQLYSNYPKDRLFRRTCEFYNSFCSSGKIHWIKYELDHFENYLSGRIVPTNIPHTVLQLLDMISYGARIFHSQPGDPNCEKDLKSIIEKYGMEMILFEFNCCLRHLCNPVFNVFEAIRRDVQTWTNDHGLAGPEKVDLPQF